MLYLYTGTPGSGKSLHATRDIYEKLRASGNVIANYYVNTSKIKPISKRRCLGRFIYKTNEELTVRYLKQFAKENHVQGKENQTLVVIDESQVLFNSRDYSRSDRRGFISFFCEHRRYGYSFIFITQNDRLLDRQIRALFEYEYKHRKVNNYGFVGSILPFETFCSIKYWYLLREKLGKEFFTYKKKYGDMYNSYISFDEIST